jgi:DNA-binding GntR family transcriptional regulator
VVTRWRPFGWHTDDVTKWRQIADDLAERIASGELTTPALIPSRRELVKSYGVADGTVKRALEYLVAEGLIESVPQVGFRVTGQTAGSLAKQVATLRGDVDEMRRRLDNAGL